MFFILMILCLIAGAAILQPAMRKRQDHKKRADFISSYRFPASAWRIVRQQLPQLNPEQQQLVDTALRQFLLACQKAQGQTLAMPSYAADLLWHGFILDTREYAQFCESAFSRKLRHSPGPGAADSMQRSWHVVCKLTGVHPREPERMPLLFGLDEILHLAQGKHYRIMGGQLLCQQGNASSMHDMGKPKGRAEYKLPGNNGLADGCNASCNSDRDLEGD